MFKKIIYLFLVCLSLSCFISCDENTNTDTNPNIDKSKYSEYIDDNHVVLVMEVKDFGNIIYQLDKENAPLTVEHFCSLADEGLLDQTYFIRMQEGFVLQGGAGSTSEKTVKGEFTSNGVNNTLSHDVGVISMARSSEADSANTQFFIVISEDAKASLDGSYAAFGKIVDGYDVVEAICDSITYDDLYENYYYGYYMGFLKETSYIEITKVYTIYE